MFTLQEFAKAFEKWENGYRIDPSAFMTNEEVAAAEVSEVSVSRAEFFMELLMENKE